MPSGSPHPVSASTSHPASKLWHTLPGEQAVDELNSNSVLGLNADQVSDRLASYGLNQLEEGAGRGTWEILIDQFSDVMLLMLIGVAIVSAGLDIWEGIQEGNFPFPKDAIAICTIVILNAILGYVQESRAEKALAALKQLSAPNVRVLRQGSFAEIDSRDLVPGDIMMLEAGNQVAADGRILAATNLQIRESALTGESHAVEKQADLLLDAAAGLGDRLNVVYQGTEVIQGRGQIIVTATGMRTELGKIASMLQGVETEPTPLQRRMTQLGQVLVTGAMVLVLLVVVGGTLALGWGQFRQLLEISLSMAVAVVPEGLPAAITVTLALGTQRMVRRHALIRRLPAVETLGSVTTICSDKTGTLTQNKMVVQWLEMADYRLRVSGDGYAPVGEFRRMDRDEDRLPLTLTVSEIAAHYPELRLLLVACVLCNDAILQQDTSADWEHRELPWLVLGDPTEGALLALAGKANVVQEVWSKFCPRVAEIPFSSERKRMNVFVELQPAELAERQVVLPSVVEIRAGYPCYLMFVKGSPELVLNQCDRRQMGTDTEAMTEAIAQEILEHNDALAARGLRVLGIAYKPLDRLPDDPADAEMGAIWLGLVGMQDAPRPEAREAVARSQQAGIRPMMITGDHQLTARAIATDLGIATRDAPVLSGQEIEALSQAELERAIEHVAVYARVSPEHKLRIVQALQSQGEIVAMTGDGVNDAPALKQANIGIAMGITGTDASKEASDMVLLDDNFASIIAATEEGRVVYDNIRRFIKYILGSNIGEVIVIASAPILLPMGGVPLTPLQILWMNLVTDGLPALALAMEPATPEVMCRPPHPPQESIFARGLGSYMVRIGIVFAVFTIILMTWSYHYAQNTSHPESWKTMVFTTLCVAQMGHALAVRSHQKLIIEMDLLSNPYVLWSVTVTTMLQLLLVYVPPLQDFFGTVPLDPLELAVCLGFSSLVLVWIEMEKVVIRTYDRWTRRSRSQT